MRDCVASRLRLPDLKGIRLGNVSDADADLVNFLCDCTPARLKLLVVNYFRNSDIGIKSKFYVDAFSRAARRTTKEVLFNCIDFSAEDLQTIVKAACNAERIVFRYCCIHCSSGLDFGANLSYNTKFLSFYGWGSTYYVELTTDFKEDPSKFSLIVDAIGRSGLRVSLEKLNIKFNQTLSVSEVQEELNAKDMSHISVVEEDSNPLKS